MTYDPKRHHRRSIRLRGYDYAQPGAYFVTIVVQGRECLFGEVVNGEVMLSDAGRMVERWWTELAHKFPMVTLDAFVVMPNHVHGIIVISPVVSDPVCTAPVCADHVCADPVCAAPVGADPVGADLCVRPDNQNNQRVRPDNQNDQCIRPDNQNNQYVRPNGQSIRPDGMGANTDRGTHVGVPLPACVPLPEIVQWYKTMTTNEYIRQVRAEGWPPFLGRLWQRNYYEHIIRNDISLEQIRRYIAENPARWQEDAENPFHHGGQP
jgi:putative transposase